MKNVRKKDSLKTKLILSIIFITMIIMFILVGFEYFQNKGINKKVFLYNSKQDNTLLAANLSGYFNEEIALTLKASLSTSVINWLKNEDDVNAKSLAFKELKDYLTILWDKHINIYPISSENIYEVDENTTFSEFIPINKITKEDWFYKTISKQGTLGCVIDSSFFNTKKKIFIDTKIVDSSEKDNLIGVIGIGIDLNDKIKEVFSKNQINGSESIVINNKGTIIIDYNTDSINKNLMNNWKDAFHGQINNDVVQWINKNLNDNVGAISMKMENANNKYVALAPIVGTDCFVVTLYNTEDLFLHRTTATIIYIFLIIVLLIILFVMVYEKLFVEPLNKILYAVENTTIYREMDVKLEKRKDEIGLLAYEIKNMSDNLMKSIPTGIFVILPDLTLRYANAYFLEQFKYDTITEFEHVLKTNHRSIHANPKDFGKLTAIIAEGEFNYVDKIQYINKEGTLFWAEIKLTKRESEEGVFWYEGVLLNIDKAESDKKQLIERMYTDKLTGIYNRTYFNEVAVQKVKECRLNGKSVHMIIFDLDHFKRVNDTYGHNVGDEVLIETAQIAKSCVRDEDILCRWGGEEFAMIVLGGSATYTYNIASQIREKLEGRVNKVAGQVTASFGFAELYYGQSLSELFKNADTALYEAKQKGRNKVVQFTAPFDFISKQNELYFKDFEGFELKEEQLSGNAEIDQDHEKLIKLVKNLIKDIENEKPISDSIKIIMDSILMHYELEEKLMASLEGFPKEELDRHMNGHKNLQNKFKDIYEGLQNETMNLSEIISLLINDVVINHIIGSDVKYFPYIHKEEK